MDASKVLETLKDSKEDGPLVRCFKRFVSSAEDCGRELEQAYNSVLPQNAARGVVFAALSGASTVVAELAKNLPRDERDEKHDGDKRSEEEADLDEETLRELPWGRVAADSYVILRVVAAVGGAAVLQDAEGSVVLASGEWSTGTLLLWNRPHLRLSRDRRLRLVGARGHELSAEKRSDVRYLRHPFVRGACDTCGKDEGSRLACGRCRVAQYCAPECQKKAWPNHRQICIPKPS
jgi:hypothetical protein